MPNQKQRKKKDGVNKEKKTQAMREKQARANPRPRRSDTGQGVGELLKPNTTIQDRPGGFRRA
jgi:hypothetical protein